MLTDEASPLIPMLVMVPADTRQLLMCQNIIILDMHRAVAGGEGEGSCVITSKTMEDPTKNRRVRQALQRVGVNLPVIHKD